MSQAGSITTPNRRQVRIRSLMAWVVGIALFCALARIDLFLAIMTTVAFARLAIPAMAGRRAGRVVPLVLLAAASDLFLVGLWPLWRDAAQSGVLMAAGIVTRAHMAENFRRILMRPDYWIRLWAWEAWSLSRWWLLFGFLTWLTGRRSKQDRAEAARSYLRFSPWLILMEYGFLLGAWLGFGSFDVVPEPNTIHGNFADFPLGLLHPGFLRFWLVRSTAPTILVGLAFLLTVARWPRKRAWVGAFALIPVAIAWSILWSGLWLVLAEYNIVP